MKYLAAIALMVAAFATITVAQRGRAGSGFAGTRGFTGHSAFSGHIGSSAPRAGWRPAEPFGRGSFVGSRSVPRRPPMTTGFSTGYRGFGFAQNRPGYGSDFSRRSQGWYHDRDRDRHSHHGRAPYFAGWRGFGFPGWAGYTYPYLLNPGFFDWDDSQNSAYDQGGSAAAYANQLSYTDPGPAPDMPDESSPVFTPPQSRPAPQSDQDRSGGSFAPIRERPLTVIFKDGRAPRTMENYMLTAKILTDLDAQHDQEIPLDEIDVAATEQANRCNGVDFQVPTAARN